MEVKFSENEVAVIMKRYSEMMKIIHTILELRGVTGPVDLLPDFSGYAVKEEECQQIQK